MAANYPSSLPVKSAAGAMLSTNPHSALHNNMYDEIVAIATELATDPAGKLSGQAHATVDERLAALEGPWLRDPVDRIDQTYDGTDGTQNIAHSTEYSRYLVTDGVLYWVFHMTATGSGTNNYPLGIRTPVPVYNDEILPGGVAAIWDASDGYTWGGMATVYGSLGRIFRDDFNRADGGAGTNWTGSNLLIVSNQYKASTGSWQRGLYSGFSFSTGCYAAADVYDNGATSGYADVLVKCDGTQDVGYFFRWNFADGGSYQIVPGGNHSNGGTPLAEVTGVGTTGPRRIYGHRNNNNDIRMVVDGVEVLSVTDSTFTAAGYAGLATLTSTASFDNFNCGYPEPSGSTWSHVTITHGDGDFSRWGEYPGRQITAGDIIMGSCIIPLWKTY